MTLAQQFIDSFPDRPDSQALMLALDSVEPILAEAIEKDQDWETGSTTWTFTDDRSAIVVCGPDWGVITR